MYLVALTICTSISRETASENTNEKIPRGIANTKVMGSKAKTKTNVKEALSSPMMNERMMSIASCAT